MERTGLPLAILGSLAAAAAHAVPPPRSPIESVETIRSGVEPAAGLVLGSFAIVFESTTFADVARLGHAPIEQAGDAGGFVMWVCFTLSTERQRIWLTSGPLGGRKYVTGSVAQVLPPGTTATPDCPELPTEFRGVQLDSDVWLGSALEELQRRFGPSAQTGSIAYFAYLGKDRDYDVLSTLVVQLEDQRVVALYANRVTTN